jgi:hypothetical protein
MTDRKLKAERKRIRRFAALDITHVPPKQVATIPTQYQRSTVTTYVWRDGGGE